MFVLLEVYLTAFTVQNTFDLSKGIGNMHYSIKKQKYLTLVVSYRAYYVISYC